MSQAPARGLVAQAKRQPGKTATLGMLVAMMAIVWGRALVGGEDERAKAPAKPSPNASLNPAAAASSKSKPATPATTPARPIAGEIESFATAIARLEKWRRPLGIEKAAPLTEELLAELRVAAEQAEQDRLDRLAAARGVRDRRAHEELPALPDSPEVAEDAAMASSPAPNAFADSAPITVDLDLEVDLVLTGTAIFGATSYALFGEDRVQVGESIGRYRVKAVRPREVDVVFDGKLTVIRMEPPDLTGGTDL